MRRNILKHPVCVQTGKTTYKIYYLQVKLEELYILDIFFEYVFSCSKSYMENTER